MKNIVPVALCKVCGGPWRLGLVEYMPGQEIPQFGKEDIQRFYCCGEWQTRNREEVEYWSKSKIAAWNKRPKPVAVCTHCGAVSHNATVINGRCSRMISNERCRGGMISALGKNDWEACPSCSASGYKGPSTLSCDQCEGVGWLFVRPRR